MSKGMNSSSVIIHISIGYFVTTKKT